MMVNDNMITAHQYLKVCDTLRRELSNVGCETCRLKPGDFDCWCDIDYQPSEEYVMKVARKICLSIGEPLDDDTFEEEIIE
jgi:hypothetical protein